MIVRWWWFCLVLRNLSISKVTLNKSTTSLFECVLLVVGEVSVRMRVVSGRWSWKRSNISLFKCVYVVGEVSVQMRLCRRWSCKRFNTSLFKCATLLVCTAVWRLLNWVPINNTHSLSGVQWYSIPLYSNAWHCPDFVTLEKEEEEEEEEAEEFELVIYIALECNTSLFTWVQFRCVTLL